MIGSPDVRVIPAKCNRDFGIQMAWLPAFNADAYSPPLASCVGSRSSTIVTSLPTRDYVYVQPDVIVTASAPGQLIRNSLETP